MLKFSKNDMLISGGMSGFSKCVLLTDSCVFEDHGMFKFSNCVFLRILGCLNFIS